jgi:phage-related protein
MAEQPQKVPVVFYSTASGNEVVRDWLRILPAEERNLIGQDLMRVQFRWPVGMPLCRSLRKGIWELRCSLPGNRIARVLFAFVDERLVALHGFVKKTRKLPDEDLRLAIKRKAEFEAKEKK